MPDLQLQLLDRIARTATDHSGRIAYAQVTSGTSLTYGELHHTVGTLRRTIVDRVGNQGTVLLHLRDQRLFACWFLAALQAGLRVFPVSSSTPGAEVTRLGMCAGAASVVSDRDGPAVLHDTPARESLIVDESRHLLGRAEYHGAAELLLATSGTTAVPRIVRRSTASLDAVSEAVVVSIGIRVSDIVLATVPFSHSYGLEHGLLAPLWSGATVRLADGMEVATRRQSALDGVTIIPGVPALIELLGSSIHGSPSRHSLRLVYTAGGPLPRGVGRQFEIAFGVRVGQVYGMTEVGSVTFNDPADENFDPLCVGRPMTGASIRVRGLAPSDPAAGRPDARDGEVLIRARSMLHSFMDSEPDWDDGHFASGDLGRLDHAGRLTISGRRGLLIDVGRLKVNPLEVEAALRDHPGVAECLVVAMAHGSTSHRLRAIIVPRDHAHAPDIESIRAFVSERLPAAKIPRHIEFRRALPRTASGKLLRTTVEER